MRSVEVHSRDPLSRVRIDPDLPGLPHGRLSIPLVAGPTGGGRLVVGWVKWTASCAD